MFGALKRGFRSMASLILVRNVVGELQPIRTLAASRGFLAAARLSCWLKYNGFDTVRKTTKLIERGRLRGHRGFRTIGILLRFFQWCNQDFFSRPRPRPSPRLFVEARN